MFSASVLLSINGDLKEEAVLANGQVPELTNAVIAGRLKEQLQQLGSLLLGLGFRGLGCRV